MKKWIALALAIAAFCITHGLAPPLPRPSFTTDAVLDQALKREILRDNPHLAAELKAGNRYAAARTILHWVAPRVPAAGGSQQIAPYEMSAGEVWYEWFRPLRGGVMCGGAADFLKKALALFSIPATTIDFGDTTVFTHVVVLVPYPHPPLHGRYWAVLDPTFDLEIVSRRTGQPVFLRRAAKIAAAGRARTLLTARSASLARRWVLNPVHGAERCGRGIHTGMCGLQNLARDRTLRRLGYADGISGLLMLFHNGRIYRPNTVPPEILKAHSRYRPSTPSIS
jgi:hypothetical protein